MGYVYRQPYPNELWHFGILGMKWGVRRFQYPDGSLTTAGKKRYGQSDPKTPNQKSKTSGKAATYSEPKTKGKTDLSAESWRNDPERHKMFMDAEKQMRYSTDSDEEKDTRVHIP